MGRLTTHVLDTASGKPAAGIRLTLWAIDDTLDIKTALKTVETNDDGRTDTPLLKDQELQPGTYELIFEVGTYFKQVGGVVSDPPFLDQIPIRFTVDSAESHFHIPLLVSPWSYSTYRGS